MSKQFTTTVPVVIDVCGIGLELTATVRFTFVPADPGSPPSYASGGDPPEPAGCEDVEVIELTIDDAAADAAKIDPIPPFIANWIIQNVDDSALLEAVPDGPDPDEGRERARDDRDDDRAHVAALDWDD